MEVDSRELDTMELEGREVDSRELVSKEPDNRKLGSRELGSRELSSRELGSRSRGLEMKPYLPCGATSRTGAPAGKAVGSRILTRVFSREAWVKPTRRKKS